jgi:phage terminase large subunit-like protein
VPWRGPTYEGEFPSLGHGVAEWVERYLVVPAGPSYGQPLRLTDRQYAKFVRWYRIDPTTGRFVYRRGADREAKGTGKSPVAAAKAAVELAGPVVFDGWDAAGEPVGRPWPTPWVQVAATSEDQTDNTYSALFAMLTSGSTPDELRLDVGLTRIFLKDRPGRIEPVTAAAGSREGQPVTFSVLDETHLWLPRSGGIKLASTIRRNVAKTGGRTWETTNAYLSGEGSVAERTHEAARKKEPGLLYLAEEAPGPGTVEWLYDVSDVELRKALEVPYRDTPWVDLGRLVQEIRDPATDPTDALRFYLNRVVTDSRAAVDVKTWDRLADPTVPPDGTLIALGFDGSESDDFTAIIATTFDGRHQFVVGMWDPADQPDGRVPRLEVEDTVAEVFDRFRVGRMFCDPSLWRVELERWARRYGEDVVLEFPQNDRRMAPATDRWLTSVRAGGMTHDGDVRFRAHVVGAHRKESSVRADADGRRLPVLVKGQDRRKIDAAVAAVMSMEAAATMPEPAKAAPLPMVAFT